MRVYALLFMSYVLFEPITTIHSLRSDFTGLERAALMDS